MAERYRKALVTGATSGIGESFARMLPDETDLLLTGRHNGRLKDLQKRLHQKGRKIEILSADLATAEGRQSVVAWGREHDIDLLVNNAGFGRFGPMLLNDPKDEVDMVEVNVTAVVELTLGLLPGMMERARNEGFRAGVIVVSSGAAFAPYPFLATYAATKTFELNWAHALSQEMKFEPCDVLALCPSVTRTQFAERSGMPAAFFRNADHPDQVARKALAALGKQSIYVCGGAQKFAMFPSLAMRRVMAASLGRVMRRFIR